MPRWVVERVASTGSTNLDVVAAARAGAPEGTVLVAGEQTAGRGRLGRAWVSPPGTSLSCSVLLRPPAPSVPPARWTWLPLLAGVAVSDAVRAAADVPAVLKWPNDVLVGAAKLAGILVERIDTADGAAAVVGIGVNVAQAADDLPPGATSLRLAGPAAQAGPSGPAGPGIDGVLDAVLAALADRYGAWVAAAGDPTRSGLGLAYRDRCATLGLRVRVERPAAGAVVGEAVGIDDDGRLVLAVGPDRVAVGAGDVVHVRPAPDPRA